MRTVHFSDCLFGGCLPRGVSAHGGVWHTPPVDRDMPVKILPCPKLRLWAAIIILCISVELELGIQSMYIPVVFQAATNFE